MELSGNQKYLHSRTNAVILRCAQDAVDVMALDYEHATGRFLFLVSNFAPEFFELKTGVAGAILQKFSNYQIKAAILGDMTALAGPRFKEFMQECNRGRQLHFTQHETEAIAWLGA